MHCESAATDDIRLTPTHAEAIKAMEVLDDYLKDRHDSAHGEDDHITASKGTCRLMELRKLIKSLEHK